MLSDFINLAQQQERFTYPEGATVLHTKEYAIVVQTGYLEYPLQESMELWTVGLRCGTTNTAVTCTSVNCPFWQHFSQAGRLLVQSALCFGYSDIQRVFPGCNSTSVTVTSFDQEQNYQLSYTGNWYSKSLMLMLSHKDFFRYRFHSQINN